MTDHPDLAGILDRGWSLSVGGRPAAAASGRTYDDESPVTEDVIARVPDAGPDDVDAAVRAGLHAAPGWRRSTKGSSSPACGSATSRASPTACPS